ncbi:MAG: dihydrofolate reductase family protein [Candidatus Gracilibacteria bacterium]|nr:dihydrofolate reductase family protein [Candidatus Gracilibacteria bacterium]
MKSYLPYLCRAIELAEKGRGFVSPNPVVGALLVRKGKIIAEDWHRKIGEGHAERNLLGLFTESVWPDDVLYITLEPCCHVGKTPPCTDIILEKGVKKVVVGLYDPNPLVRGKGVDMLRGWGVEVLVLEEEQGEIQRVIAKEERLKQSREFLHSAGVSGLLRRSNPEPSAPRNDSLEEKLLEDLKWQNRFFFKWVQQHRPWVSLKIAQTLDGRIVPERGQQLWLTGKESQVHVHQMRAQYDAILVGAATVIDDDPALTVRNEKGKVIGLQPIPVVLDAALSVPLDRQVLHLGTIVFRGRQFRRRESRKLKLLEKGVQVLEVDTTEKGYLHLGQILDELAARGVTSLYVEGGPSIWSSFLREGLVDELMIYMAPQFLGAGVLTFEDLGFEGAKELQFREMKQLGNDVYVVYSLVAGGEFLNSSYG